MVQTQGLEENPKRDERNLSQGLPNIAVISAYATL